MHYLSVDEEDDKLQREVEAHMRSLDEHPDPWFERPEGFLLKPDYKRAMQQRDTFKEQPQRIKDFIGRAGYNRRYFVLEGGLLRYFKEKTSTTESGTVDVSKVESIRLSLIPDAPAHSLDLVTQDRIYTICADSRESLVRWAVAISFVMSTGSPRSRARTLNWEEFSVRFEDRQPLLLNIKGVANRDVRIAPLTSHWLMVAGFEKHADGSCGPAEACRLIEPLDVIIGVNNQDISANTFNDSLEIIRTASWPMTLHFLRDRSGKPIETPKKEGWCRIGQGARSVKRRRYAELKTKELSVFRPMPGGSASSTREIFLKLKHISRIEKLIDHRCKPSEVYQLIVTVATHHGEEETKDVARPSATQQGQDTDRDSFPDFVGSFYARQHGHEVEAGVVELCFGLEREMDQWHAALVASLEADRAVIVEQPQVIQEERNEPEATAAPVLESNLYLRDEVTGKYLLRHFELRGPNLSWRKPAIDEPLQERGRRAQSLSRLRHLNLRDCRLEGFQLSTAPSHAQAPYRISLTVIKPQKQHFSQVRLVLGMMDEDMQAKWADALRPFMAMRRIMLPGLPDMPDTPNSACDPEVGTPSSPPTLPDDEKQDEETAAATLYMLAPGSNARLPWENLLTVSEEQLSDLRSTRVHCGWLYKQGVVRTTVQNLNSITKPTSTAFLHTYRKRFFVLHEDRLEYYKTPIQALESHPTGRIDLSKAIEVRSCPDPMTPEYSLEIITTTRHYVLVPFNEEQHRHWLQLLSEATDAYGDTKLSLSHMQDGPELQPQDQPEIQIRQSLKMGGMLQKKLTDTMTAWTTWKPRYCALTTGQLVFYASEEDLYDEEGDPLGVVPLAAIQSVSTTTDPKPHEGHGFEVISLMQHRDGTRKERLIFEASSTEDAKDWVHAICKATQRLAVRDVTSTSVESYEMEPVPVPVEEKFERAPSRSASVRSMSAAVGGVKKGRRFSVTHKGPTAGGDGVEVTELPDNA